MKIELAKTEVIHFIGIGGIGMSGIAELMQKIGYDINKIIDSRLEKKILDEIEFRKP